MATKYKNNSTPHHFMRSAFEILTKLILPEHFFLKSCLSLPMLPHVALILPLELTVDYGPPLLRPACTCV